MSKHIIGDIHGCYYTLYYLLDEIIAKDKDPVFIFTGDYIDRGSNSKLVIDHLLRLKRRFQCHFLLGNHDDVFKYFLGLPTITNLGNYIYGKISWDRIYSWMKQHGLDQTLNSFGINEIEDLTKLDSRYKEFFENLEIGYIDKDCFVFHGFYPNQEIPRDIKFIKSSQKEELIWGRFDNLLDKHLKYSEKWDRIGVFGHTPTRYITGNNDPIILDKIIIADTDACRNGFLTAINITDKTYIQVPTDKRDIL